jgi:hypothetical protein
MEYVLLAKGYYIDGRKAGHVHESEIFPVREYYRKQKKLLCITLTIILGGKSSKMMKFEAIAITLKDFFLTEPSLQKFYVYLFYSNILTNNKKKSKKAYTICFEARISRKMKWNF